MEPLYMRELYGASIAVQIEVTGSISIEIANRWALGWPDRVVAMLTSGTYMQALLDQSEMEKDVLANEYAPHLARAEILQMHGVALAPPRQFLIEMS